MTELLAELRLAYEDLALAVDRVGECCNCLKISSGSRPRVKEILDRVAARAIPVPECKSIYDFDGESDA